MHENYLPINYSVSEERTSPIWGNLQHARYIQYLTPSRFSQLRHLAGSRDCIQHMQRRKFLSLLDQEQCQIGNAVLYHKKFRPKKSMLLRSPVTWKMSLVVNQPSGIFQLPGSLGERPPQPPLGLERGVHLNRVFILQLPSF